MLLRRDITQALSPVWLGWLWSPLVCALPGSTPGMGTSWLQLPPACLGAAGDTLGTSPCGSVGDAIWSKDVSHERVGSCVQDSPCAQQEGGDRLELGFQGCRVLGGIQGQSC